MAETPTITAFSIRKDGVEVEKPSGTAAQAGVEWKAEADAAPAGVKVDLYALYSDGNEELRGWSCKPLPSDWESPEACVYFQMNDETLSLVKLAQEMCNGGTSPHEATTRLLDLARSEPALRYLQEADQDQAIAELERRFSGYATKPWEVATDSDWENDLNDRANAYVGGEP